MYRVLEYALIYNIYLYITYTFIQLVKVDNPSAQNEPTEDSKKT